MAPKARRSYATAWVTTRSISSSHAGRSSSTPTTGPAALRELVAEGAVPESVYGS